MKYQNKSFTNSFDEIGLDSSNETPHHHYFVRATDKAAFHYAIPK